MLQSTNALSRADAPRLFAWRAALLFCAPMMVNGIGLLYFPVYLEDLKMSDIEIGIIVSIPFLVRMIGMPLGAFLADRVSDRAVILIWSAVVSFITTVMMFFTHSFWPVVFFYGIQSLFYSPYVPIAEAILVTGVRRWAFDYGYLRMWGSIAFVFSTLAGGWLLDLYGGSMVLPSMAFFFVLTILVAASAPRLGRPMPVAADQTASTLGNKSPFWRLDFLLVIIGAGLVQGSHGMLFGFATNYWTTQGISGMQISFLWTAGVVAEILLFFISGRYLARFSIWSLILFGSVAAVARWSLFPMIHGFWPHLALQSMHAFTFAIIHVGIQRFMMARVGDERGASAQGFYQFFVCLFNVLTAWSSGFIFQAYGVEGFHAMTIVAVAGVGFVVAAMVLQPQSARSGG
ncbi:MFS transporter [Rhizobium sp. LjRoot254]|uniref:MFS transporter n=1 Tax=Rhizobium sp. LjRoot254 TaxID=3342297 RepID=UPI003ED10662